VISLKILIVAALVIAGVIWYFLGLYPAVAFLAGFGFAKIWHWMK